METTGAAKVAARITVEAENKPGQLNEIFEFDEAAQRTRAAERDSLVLGSCSDKFWSGTAERHI